jgi:hypothetical protein
MTPELNRRQYLGILGCLSGGLGWLTMDPAGNVADSPPPRDSDYDGWFEDIDGNGQVNTRDLAAYTHESFEDLMHDELSHGFSAGQIIDSLGGQDNSKNNGDFRVAIHLSPELDPATGETAAKYSATAANNMMNYANTGARVGISHIGTLEIEGDAVTSENTPSDQFLEDFTSSTDDRADAHIYLSSEAPAGAYSNEESNHAVITGAKEIETLESDEGVPLLTGYEESRIAHGLGLAIGLPQKRTGLGEGFAIMYTDGLNGDQITVTDPMDPRDLEGIKGNQIDSKYVSSIYFKETINEKQF